jgi:hypothetical protein
LREWPRPKNAENGASFEMTSSNALKCVVSDYEMTDEVTPRIVNTIELFSGTKSFSKVADSLGHKTFTIDKFKHREVKSGCDANDDGIPPNNKLLGILPNFI